MGLPIAYWPEADAQLGALVVDRANTPILEAIKRTVEALANDPGLKPQTSWNTKTWGIVRIAPTGYRSWKVVFWISVDLIPQRLEIIWIAELP